MADDSEEASAVESGTVKPGYYKSDYFGLSLSFPQAWTVVPEKAPHQFQKRGGDALVGDGVLKRDVVDADQGNTHNLLKIISLLDPFTDYTPSIRIVAEGIHEGAPFQNAEGYIAHTTKLLAAMRSSKYRVVETACAVSLGGEEFCRVELAAELPNTTVKQFYYARLIRGFAVSIVVSAGNGDQLARTARILQELHFDARK